MQASDPNEVAALGKPSLKARLEAYYSIISPETIADQSTWRSKFDQIFEKYGGSYEGERKLATKLAKKYGTAVRLLVAKPNNENTQQARRASADGETSVTLRDEYWYKLRPEEQDSKDVSFVSDRFDPFAALSAPGSTVLAENPWIAQCPRLDTVGQFALHLPKNDPLRVSSLKARKRSTPPGSESDRAHSTKTTNDLHPFDLIAHTIERGPLSRLYDFRRKRVRIVVRYVNAIRGTLIGTLVAFDKHMNMILKDVEETYSVRPVQPTGTDSNIDIESRRRQKLKGSEPCSEDEWFGRRRRMRNLLVRGDNVVAISIDEQAKEGVESRYYKGTKSESLKRPQKK